MKHGTINCSCGQMFYFETVNDSIPCITCKTIHDITAYPEKVEEEILEVEGDI